MKTSGQFRAVDKTLFSSGMKIEETKRSDGDAGNFKTAAASGLVGGRIVGTDLTHVKARAPRVGVPEGNY